MWSSLYHFLSYHNAVPIALGVLFLGGGVALASTPVVQEAFIDSQEVVESIDNTRIVAADLDTLPFELRVVSVTEDETSYYVEYTLQTIELVEYVWQDIEKLSILKVAKDALQGRDLGVYATEELSEVRESTIRRLKETQKYERALGASQKVVATVYSGLVGALLDPTQEVFPAYTPVIAEPVGDNGASSGGAVLGSSTSSDTTPPSISILGDNPARIPLDTAYEDLGVLVSDNVTQNITVALVLNDVPVSEIVIDTSVVSSHVIEYRATDEAGNTSTARREVVVDNPPSSPVTPPPPPATTTPPAAEIEPEIPSPATSTATTTP